MLGCRAHVLLKWLFQLNECWRNPIKVHQLHKLCLQRRIEQLVVIFHPRSEPLLLENEGIWKQSEAFEHIFFLCIKSNKCERVALSAGQFEQSWPRPVDGFTKLFDGICWLKGPMWFNDGALKLFNCSTNAKWDKQKTNRFVHSENMTVGILR